jgi:hypothetical protein
LRDIEIGDLHAPILSRELTRYQSSDGRLAHSTLLRHHPDHNAYAGALLTCACRLVSMRDSAHASILTSRQRNPEQLLQEQHA